MLGPNYIVNGNEGHWEKFTQTLKVTWTSDLADDHQWLMTIKVWWKAKGKFWKRKYLSPLSSLISQIRLPDMCFLIWWEVHNTIYKDLILKIKLKYEQASRLNCHCCSAAKSCLTLFDCRMPGSFVLHYLPEFAQTPVHWVGDAI